MTVNNINEWMSMVAQAITEYDYEMVNELENISYGWLQPEEELRSQQRLIEAAYEAIER